MNLNLGGIKCGNPSCDYHCDEVKVEEYTHWLNKPCPKCGHNLLTEADYKAVLLLQKLSNHWFIQLLDKVGRFLGFRDKKIKIEMNGSGKVNLKELQ